MPCTLCAMSSELACHAYHVLCWMYSHATQMSCGIYFCATHIVWCVQ